jgi:hypothetical protein
MAYANGHLPPPEVVILYRRTHLFAVVVESDRAVAISHDTNRCRIILDSADTTRDNLSS